MMIATDVCRAAGITYRQLDWHPEHVVHPFQHDYAIAYRDAHTPL